MIPCGIGIEQILPGVHVRDVVARAGVVAVGCPHIDDDGVVHFGREHAHFVQPAGRYAAWRFGQIGCVGAGRQRNDGRQCGKKCVFQSFHGTIFVDFDAGKGTIFF